MASTLSSYETNYNTSECCVVYIENSDVFIDIPRIEKTPTYGFIYSTLLHLSTFKPTLVKDANDCSMLV